MAFIAAAMAVEGSVEAGWDGVARGFERTTKSRAGCAGYRGLARVAGAVRAQQEAGRRGNGR